MIQALVTYIEWTFYLNMIPGFRIIKALIMVWMRLEIFDGALYLYHRYLKSLLNQVEYLVLNNKMLQSIPESIKSVFM